MNSPSQKSPMTSAEMADKERRSAETRANARAVLFVVFLFCCLFFFEYNTGYFANSQREHDQKQALIQKVSSMDCNAAMKTQADLVIAGRGVQARELNASVENACTPAYETGLKVFFFLCLLFGVPAVYLVFMGGRRF